MMMMNTTLQTPGLKSIAPSPDHIWDEAAQSWALRPLEQVRTAALTRVDALHAQVLERTTGLPTQAEKDTWTLKLETAKAITAKTAISATGAAFLVAAGITTDAAKTDWATRVMAYADAYAKAVGACEKWRTDARAAVRAAANHPDLQKAEATALQAVLNIT